MKILKNTNAQAALEFLTTYGWAFLIILIMIGTLAYFGILSPSRILPSRCSFGSEFQCLDYQITENGATSTVGMRLKNGVGQAVTVSSIGVGSDGTTSVTCTNPTLPTNWKSGESVDLSFTGCSNMAAAGIVKGEKGKVNVTMDYYMVTSSSTYTKQVKGEIYTTVR